MVRKEMPLITREQVLPKPELKSLKSGHLKGLDGFRGVAIFLVVLFHSRLAGTYTGFIGVDMFFVLSGYLITRLLVEEWEQTNRVSLKRFYVRRCLRLLPALLVLLICFVVISWVCFSRKAGLQAIRESLVAFFYMMNWARALHISDSIALGHTWTLSIEEQFYLIWPCLLMFLIRHVSRPTLINLLLLGAALSCIEHFVLDETMFGTPMRQYNGLDTRADSLLLGCAVGILTKSNVRHVFEQRKILLRYAAIFSFLALLAISTVLGSFIAFDCYLVWFLISLFAAIILTELVVAETGPFHRILEFAPLVYMGRISYGLYLWHSAVFAIAWQTKIPHWKILTFGTLFSLAATLASFYVVEKPFLKLKRHFDRPVSEPIVPAS
jgi:peptidoglycan/LPS O-acetylase OafA/YrhL